MSADPHIAERRNQQRVDSLERTRVRNQTVEQERELEEWENRRQALESYGLSKASAKECVRREPERWEAALRRMERVEDLSSYDQDGIVR